MGRREPLRSGISWPGYDVRGASAPVTRSAACTIPTADQRFIFAGQALSSISASARGRADCRMPVGISLDPSQEDSVRDR